jgi:hypothetical protein
MSFCSAHGRPSPSTARVVTPRPAAFGSPPGPWLSDVAPAAASAILLGQVLLLPFGSANFQHLSRFELGLGWPFVPVAAAGEQLTMGDEGESTARKPAWLGHPSPWLPQGAFLGD